MNPKRAKEKERRRARKLAEEAWEAAEAGNLDLAEKIIRRAVATQADNPVLWNDQGVLLALRGKDRDAEDSLRTAIAMAPSFAEPFAHLAKIQAKHGYLRDAVRLMEQAVQRAPESADHEKRLEAYRALLACERPPANVSEPASPALAVEAPSIASPGESEWLRDIGRRNWNKLDEQLTRDGCVLIPQLVDAKACAELRCMFDDNRLFAKTVVMDREAFGQGSYRYFKAPIPKIVDLLRRSVYPHVACVANEWQRLLNEPDRFPDDWEGFRQKCAEAGQTTPTPILLRYGPGGFNALHRDLRGAVFFPIQMAVVLSLIRQEAGAEGFSGGEFLFADVPESKKSRQRVIPAGLGDAVLLCTRDRLLRVGGVYGLQPVKHGVQRIAEGTRFVLGVPFHEYR
jgi:hypothetical protein